jgi:hypothetical protein
LSFFFFSAVLAYRRILLLEGVYSKIEQVKPDLGCFLNKSLSGIDSILENLQKSAPFYRYHRLTLAETVIQRLGNLHIPYENISLETDGKTMDLRIAICT